VRGCVCMCVYVCLCVIVRACVRLCVGVGGWEVRVCMCAWDVYLWPELDLAYAALTMLKIKLPHER